MSKLSDTFTRRSFLDWLIGLGLSITAYTIGLPIIKFLFPPSKVMEGTGSKIALAKLDDIPPGFSKTVLYKNLPTLIIHHTEAGFVALSGVCTHMGCYLHWDNLKGQIVCPCHLASFDINGAVLSGPPPSPLPRYKVEVADGRIYLSGLL